MGSKVDIAKDFEEHLKIEKVYNKVFYRYLDIQGALYILRDKTLKFTNPKDFNDPLDCYEGLINYKYSASDLKRAKKEYVVPQLKGYNRHERRQIMKSYFSTPSQMEESQLKAILDMKERIGICCFSEINDNILMWSHYAKNHTGVCLGFRLHPVQKELFSLFPVRYRDEITVIDKNDDFKVAMYHWVLTKASDWSYEREVRAVSMEKNGIVSLDPLAVTEIYYGARIDKVDKLMLNNIIKLDFTHSQKFQMEIDNNSFKLKARSLKL